MPHPPAAPPHAPSAAPAPVPLVLVPGLLCDDHVWQPQIAALAPHTACWVARTEGLARLDAMAQALLDRAPWPRFALAGHSMGGRVALEVLRRAPQRVSHLALLDTGWQALPAGEAGLAERQQRLALLDLARRQGMRALGERWSPGMLHPAQHGTALHEGILQMIERRTPDEFAAQIEALLQRPDASAVLDSITCPTLLLCGRDDTWSPLARHAEMAGRVAGATLVAVDDCGHMSTLEQPAAVSQALRQWLARPAGG